MEEKKYVDFDKVITTYKTFGHLNLHNALEAFNEIPAANVQPVVRGKWIFDNPLTADFMCDSCLERQIICTPFCPNCGADMRGNQ